MGDCSKYQGVRLLAPPIPRKTQTNWKKQEKPKKMKTNKNLRQPRKIQETAHKKPQKNLEGIKIKKKENLENPRTNKRRRKK